MVGRRPVSIKKRSQGDQKAQDAEESCFLERELDLNLRDFVDCKIGRSCVLRQLQFPYKIIKPISCPPPKKKKKIKTNKPWERAVYKCKYKLFY